jgi:hypothetical protein
MDRRSLRERKSEKAAPPDEQALAARAEKGRCGPDGRTLCGERTDETGHSGAPRGR